MQLMHSLPGAWWSGLWLTAGHLRLLTGHGDYAYQQSSYTEQSYDRSFEESTQHYYESGKKQVLRAAPSAPLALDSRCCPRAPVPAGVSSVRVGGWKGWG